ncbi:MAG: anti-sigma factor [Candidatus Eremiobacteraeota bacterium]|nr:anti-sigma factor [Candidatus Eremiobacteraeota bacterium]MBC5827922.1 anti-sigma factor [Candidatus Eremiobacteraeota bacterium]
MTDQEHTAELAAAYALGAVTPEEAAEVGAHIASCSSCRDEVNNFRKLARLLPLACPQAVPSPDVKSRLMAMAGQEGVSAHRPRHRSSVSARASRFHFSPTRPALWLASAAAAALVVGGALSFNGMAQRASSARHLSAMQAEVAAMQREDLHLKAAAAANHHIVAAVITGNVWDMRGGAQARRWHCVVIQPPHGAHAMILAALPQIPKGMMYQAWLKHKGTMHSVGMLPAQRGAVIEMPMQVERGDMVAFSVEPSAGSKAPTSPYLMEHTLS